MSDLSSSSSTITSLNSSDSQKTTPATTAPPSPKTPARVVVEVLPGQKEERIYKWTRNSLRFLGFPLVDYEDDGGEPEPVEYFEHLLQCEPKCPLGWAKAAFDIIYRYHFRHCRGVETPRWDRADGPLKEHMGNFKDTGFSDSIGLRYYKPVRQRRNDYIRMKKHLTCVQCMNFYKHPVFLPCGHLLCYTCAVNLHRDKGNCFECSSGIMDGQFIFIPEMEELVQAFRNGHLFGREFNHRPMLYSELG